MASATETARVYRSVLRNRSLRRVLVAYLLFNANEYGVWIAVTIYAYAHGGPTTAGLVMIAQLIPAAIVAPLGSVLGHRLRRDHALSLGYALQAAGNVVCALGLWLAPPALAYTAAVIAGCTQVLTRPVHNSILPEIAESPEELTASNSVSSTAEGFGVMAGPLLNSVLVAVGGPALVPAAFFGALAICAVITARLRLVGGAATDPAEVDRGLEEGSGSSVGEILESAVEGARALRGDRGAAVLTILSGSQFVVLGMIEVFAALLAIDLLRIGERGVGVIDASFGVGGLIGAVTTAALVGRRRLSPAVLVALCVTGVAFAFVSLAQGVVLALVLLTVTGAARTFFDVAARTLLQRSVPEGVLTRVFGLQEGLAMLALAAGAAAAPAFIALFGARGAFVAAGVLFPAMGIATFRSLRGLDRRSDLPDPARIELLRRLDLFKPLPQFTLEQVARHLVPLRAQEGEVLIREGTAGDRFYVIVDGEATVSARGREIARCGAGDYVGEIALLRNVPRTATVIAATELELLALARDPFLAAITHVRSSSEVANREIDRRLDALGGSD